MFAQNPKKEFVVNYDMEKVREAVLKLNETEPKYYVLVKDDKILNEIRLHQKGQLLDVGYHVDFTINKVSDTETKVVVEVSRNLGTINTAAEVSIANNSLKSVTSKFSSFLSGDIDPKTGKANVPQQGCLLVTVVLLTSLITATFAVVKVFFA
ncbi:MAG: hypothetical protein ACK4RX_07905 [Chitinophagaceae bacterium]